MPRPFRLPFTIAALAGALAAAEPPSPSPPAAPPTTDPTLKLKVQSAPGGDAPRGVANFPDGSVLAVYRGRTVDGARDVQFSEWRDGHWSEPQMLASEGWITDHPPAAGPALATRDGQAAAAWFTAADRDPRIEVSLSSDGGHVWQLPIKVSEAPPDAPVAVTMLRDGSQILVWKEGDRLLLRRLSPQGDLGPITPVAELHGTLDEVDVGVLVDQDPVAPIQLLLDYNVGEHSSSAVVTLPSAKELAVNDSLCACSRVASQVPHGYELRGVVVSVDAAKGTVTANHEAIPGVMKAMTMPFKADAATIRALAPGQQFLGRMEDRDADWWLFDVRALADPVKP
jgi:Cu/Ag efflux protein CusF